MTSYTNDIGYASKTVPFSLLTDEQKRLRMLGMPTSGPAQVITGDPMMPHTEPYITGVYYPSPEELEKYRKRGVVSPVDKVVKISNGNGEVIKAAVDSNGEVVAADKEANPLVPLAIAAGLFFLLGG